MYLSIVNFSGHEIKIVVVVVVVGYLSKKCLVGDGHAFLFCFCVFVYRENKTLYQKKIVIIEKNTKQNQDKN